MKTANSISTLKNFDQIKFNTFIYEMDDDGLLVECKFTKNNKSYYATITPDFNEINEISNLLYQQTGIDLNLLLSENLLQKNLPFSEWNCSTNNLTLSFSRPATVDHSFAA